MTDTNTQFNAPLPPSEQDVTELFAPKFDDKGLIMGIASDANSGEILMVAYMNAEALSQTLKTGKAHFYSRSRNAQWMKGESSGNTLDVVEMRTDCDQDIILMKVKLTGLGAACHTGRQSCFYRTIELADGLPVLKFDGSKPKFDPKKVY